MTNTVDKHTKLDQLVVPGDVRPGGIQRVHRLLVSRIPTQDNPVEMLEGFGRTTIIGPGAIGDTRMVTEEAKAVDASHLGFLDPVDTPEGEKVGISSTWPSGCPRRERDIHAGVRLQEEGNDAGQYGHLLQVERGLAG